MSISERHSWQQHIQTVAKDFSRGREQEPYISETFIRLNVLDYKRTEQSDRNTEVVVTASSKDKLRVRSSWETNEYHLRGGCKLSNEQKSCGCV